MYKFNLNANTETANGGINKEWAVCQYYGIERHTHDNGSYDVASDVEVGDLHISVKSSGFTLMSGSKCRGCKTFEGIWRRYYKNAHSNTWAYVDNDFNCYIMNKKEFSKFVHTFGRLERESTKNGGDLKIKSLKESKKMVSWLEERCA